MSCCSNLLNNSQNNAAAPAAECAHVIRRPRQSAILAHFYICSILIKRDALTGVAVQQGLKRQRQDQAQLDSGLSKQHPAIAQSGPSNAEVSSNNPLGY